MGFYDIIKLCKARQEVGFVKYQDQDKQRDVAKDVLEEIADIINISNLRKNRLVEADYDEDIIDEYDKLQTKLECLCMEQFKVTKEIDELMHRIKYDTRDVKRIYFDE